MASTVNSIQKDTRKMAPSDAALTYFMRMPESGDTEGCIHSCVEMLRIEHGMSIESSRTTAIQAYAELRCKNSNARINVEACTDSLIAVRHNGKPIFFTVTDLMNAMEKYRAEKEITVH